MISWIFKTVTIIITITTISSCSTLNKDNEKRAKADIYYTEGTKQLRLQNYRVALDKLRTAAHLNENNSDIQNNLGMAFYFLNQPQSAIKHLLLAYENDNTYTKALSNLAAVYQTEKKYRKALKLHKKALADLVYKDRYRTYYNMALIYLKTNDSLEAVKHLTLSLKENESYCPANYQMGKWEEGKRDYNKAFQYYLKASSGTCYQDPAPILKQGIMLQKLRRYNKAIAKFDNIIGRFKKSSYATQASLRKREIFATTKQKKKKYGQPEKLPYINNNSYNQSPIF